MNIGIDLGGTKIEAVGLYPDGNETNRIRKATPQGLYTETINTICELINQLEAGYQPAETVGICTPGSISPFTGLMQNCNSTCLNGKNLKADPEYSLGRAVKMANDADCLTLSEATDGAAEGAATVFGIILGTGVGGGYAVQGKLVTGPNALAGEWGHNPLPFPVTTDRNCYCGRINCIESWISGPGISESYYEKAGQRISAEDIANMQTADTKEILDQFIEQLAASVGTIINTVDPEVMVFGGGLSNIKHIYQELPKRITNYIMPNACNTRFIQAKHGCSSGIRGAARL